MMNPLAALLSFFGVELSPEVTWSLLLLDADDGGTIRVAGFTLKWPLPIMMLRPIPIEEAIDSVAMDAGGNAIHFSDPRPTICVKGNDETLDGATTDCESFFSSFFLKSFNENPLPAIFVLYYK